MKTLKELSAITGHNVIMANFHERCCYHLLIEIEGVYWRSYYVEGQHMGITLQGTPSSNYRTSFKRMPKFKGNVE